MGSEAVQSGTVGHALMRLLWLVSSVFRFLGPGWPPIILRDLWTLAWNPGDGVLDYCLGFKSVIWWWEVSYLGSVILPGLL